MAHIWTYIMMALCASVTSAGVIDFHGNGKYLHGDEAVGVEEEKLVAPPPENGLNIDSFGLPGNSNEENLDCSEICKNGNGEDLCLCDLPTSVSEALEALLNPDNESNDYEILPFAKEDILNLQTSQLCDSLCDKGIEQPPCKCK